MQRSIPSRLAGLAARLAPVSLVLLLAVASEARAQRFTSEGGPLTVETVAKGLAHPWSLAFLPDGTMLVTERPGRLRVVAADGRLSAPVAGLPAVVAAGQGGLLDLAVDPAFAQNRLIYWTYAEARDDGNGTSVARGRLSPDLTRLTDVQVIFRQMPAWRSNMHFGSRLAFAPDGTLFVTLGERFVAREKAQDLSTHLGKVVRIRPDGSVPPDNPFVNRDGVRPEIWSYGHRNPQSLLVHPRTGRLWEVEHGARGGDEINLPEAGKNYGWPVISYGVNYDGTKIGEGTAKPGMEQPLYYWDPSIAPSGAAFVTSDRYPGWQGNLLVGALAGQMLVRLDVSEAGVRKEERLLRGLNERIRDVRQGPDGFVYLLTDDDNGRILRLKPGG